MRGVECGVRGVGCGVWGWALGVCCSRFVVRDLGCWVWVFGFGFGDSVWGVGFGVWDVGFVWVLGFGVTTVPRRASVQAHRLLDHSSPG